MPIATFTRTSTISRSLRMGRFCAKKNQLTARRANMPSPTASPTRSELS